MIAQSAAAPAFVRVAIADDSNDLCMMLAELVNSSPGLRCVAQITAQRELIEAVTASQPDVLLLDLAFGGESSLAEAPAPLPKMQGCCFLVHALLVLLLRPPPSAPKIQPCVPSWEYSWLRPCFWAFTTSI